MSMLTKGIFPYLLLLIIVFSFYGSSLANGFVHDDIWQVQERSIGRVFSGCVAEEILGGCEKGFYWRPTQYVSYFLINLVSRKPWLFHLVNLVYFWIASVLVFEFSKLLLIHDSSVHQLKKRSTNRNSNSKSSVSVSLRSTLANKPKSNSFVENGAHSARFLSWLTSLSLLAALIFVAHPINSEVVNWISATPDLLMVIFGLLCLIFYLKGTKPTFLLSLGSFFLALLSKESAAVVLPLALIAVHLLFLKPKKKLVFQLLWFIVPLVVYLALRTEVLGRVVYKYEGYWELSARDQIFTALTLLLKYLQKLIYPLPLSFQPLVEPVRSFSRQVWLGIAIAVLAVVFGANQRRFASSNTLVFGLVLILLGILPPLVFVNKLGQFLFSERYLLFSTVGLAILIASGVSKVKDRKLYWLLGLVGIVALLCSWFVVFQRNRDWRDNIASYQAMIRVDSNNTNAHFQLGKVYEGQGDTELATSEFKKAVSSDSANVEAKAELAFLDNVYSFGDVYLFHYPMGWKVSETKDRVIISEAEVGVEIVSDIKKQSQTPEQYLLGKKAVGEVLNQGLAQIPGVDFAYVRIYKTNGSYEFFLFKGNTVVRIFLSGAKSDADINDFNRILETFRIIS